MSRGPWFFGGQRIQLTMLESRNELAHSLHAYYGDLIYSLDPLAVNRQHQQQQQQHLHFGAMMQHEA